MNSELKAKIALVLGALLSLPLVRGVAAGTIPLTSAAIRVAIAMAFGYGAVSLVTMIVTGYLPKPVEEPPAPQPLPDGVEEAVLVDDQPPADTASN
jgi:hypothetical protein